MNLILNADDFGLTPGINRAIAELHDAGALTSATLMATGPAFRHAVTLALARPSLGIGCHILLTDGLPVSPPHTIPTLTPNRRTLRPKLTHFLSAALTNQIDPTDIEREAVAQIQRLQHAGLTVTHLDTHKHTHILPAILTPLLRAAARTGVPALRNPFAPTASPPTPINLRNLQLRLVQPLRRHFLHRPALQHGQIRTTDGTLGVSATGQLDEPTLRHLLANLPPGTWELVTHPGYNDPDLAQIPTRLRQSRDIERQALLAVFAKPAGQPVSQSASQPVSESANIPPSPNSSHSAPHLRPFQLINYSNLSRQPTNPLTANPLTRQPANSLTR